MNKISMKQITAAIIEDIIEEAIFIEKIINRLYPTIKIVGKAHSYEQALTLILETQPTFLFLDIRLGGDRESFDVINEIKKRGMRNFIPIFITAYGTENYAMEAYSYTGASYVKKPINEANLKEAIDKSYQQILLNTFNHDLNFEKIEQVIEQIKTNIAPEYIYISMAGGREQKIKISDVTHLKADGGVTYFYFKNKEKLASNLSLKEWERSLTQNYDFCKMHNSIIVNMNHIQKHRSFGGKNIITLSNGDTIEASRRMYENLKDELEELNPTKDRWVLRVINFFTKYFK
jgi:two-component system, LytTR family, response regulator